MCGAYYYTPNPHTLYHTPPPASTLRKERRELRKQVAESGSWGNLQRVDWETCLDKMRERTGERMRKNVGQDAASEVRQNVKAVRTKREVSVTKWECECHVTPFIVTFMENWVGPNESPCNNMRSICMVRDKTVLRQNPKPCMSRRENGKHDSHSWVNLEDDDE